MSTDATPTDRTSPRTPISGTWRAADEPRPTRRVPLLFSPTCRRRLPNTIDETNAYAGPPATR